MALSSAGKVISTILRHDDKTTTYKIALLRAINDVVLSFPDLRNFNQDVAIPLRVLAEYWVAYYWPFAGHNPIPQGPCQITAKGNKNDIAFRPLLTLLRQRGQTELQLSSQPSEGFYLINLMRIDRKRQEFSEDFLKLYKQTLNKIAEAIENPIQYAGPGKWSVFDKPAKCSDLERHAVSIPGTQPSDRCLVVSAELWNGFRDLSLWIEALCIHEWSLFTEKLQQSDIKVDRGEVYRLLTNRPDNRRPLTWERNQIDMLLMEGYEFICPWTEKRIYSGVKYAVDHLVPIAVYPINELWNLVPSDPKFNSHIKRDRLPSTERLIKATLPLELAYSLYDKSATLSRALHQDVAIRFSVIQQSNYWGSLAGAVVDLIEQVAESRNLHRF
ncbi:MAG TPA: hypothetical protein V6D10_17495 [Trichocoleus sp.]|jgi:hypothetical protein